jgi:hypothetical protein
MILSYEWGAFWHHSTIMPEPILFRCPSTGMQVQHWLPDVPEDKKDCYSSVVCPACTKLNFIHNRTGKPLGEK